MRNERTPKDVCGEAISTPEGIKTWPKLVWESHRLQLLRSCGPSRSLVAFEDLSIIQRITELHNTILACARWDIIKSQIVIRRMSLW